MIIMMMMMMMIIIIIIIIIITHVLWKVLTSRYNSVNAGTSNIRTMNSYIRIVATQRSLGTWFVSGI
jgi:hypothetical protein